MEYQLTENRPLEDADDQCPQPKKDLPAMARSALIMSACLQLSEDHPMDQQCLQTSSSVRRPRSCPDLSEEYLEVRSPPHQPPEQSKAPQTTARAIGPFHPKTGRIRKARGSIPSEAEDSDDDPSRIPIQWQRVPVGGWVTTAKSKFGNNKPKCPPCHRLKKSNPCRGPPPCRECFAKGRRLAVQCQEWGEGFVPKQRRDKLGRFMTGKIGKKE